MLALADKGYRQALLDDPGLMDGLNIHERWVCCAAVAEALGYEYVDPHRVLSA